VIMVLWVKRFATQFWHGSAIR